MKKLLSLIVIFVLAFAFFGNIGLAHAQGRNASWVVSVTYQNVGAAATTVNVLFYEEGNTDSIEFDPLGGGTIAPGAGRSFFIGSIDGIDPGFRGNAVMMSEQPLVATVVQFSQETGFKMRLLSNGFRDTDTSDQYLVATTLANTFSRTTIFSIQNIESVEIKATVRFYDLSGNLQSTKVHTIPANSSKYIEMDNIADTGLPSTTFNGSAIVTATRTSDDSPAMVVAGVSELYTDQNIAANFEGVPLSRASNTVYMATALCERFGLDTFYAVQNASLTDDATITVTYYNTNGNEKATDGPYTIGSGQKKSILTCDPNDGTDMTSFTGSATITSTGAPIVAIGKAQKSLNAGTTDTALFFTIFNGEPSGYNKLALPFIRWANDTDFNDSNNMGGKQRAFLAIQNLGDGNATVTVTYIDKNGNEVGSQDLVIEPFSKGNSSADSAGALGKSGMLPGSFGYYNDGSFGGGVIIESDQPVIAVARVQHPGAGEDYNGVPVP